MAVRIKTIPNGALGPKNPGHYGARRAEKAPDASKQVNKILELEWEALGRKLNKHANNGAELEKLRRQLKERDEMLKQANQKIAALKKELSLLQEKQRAHRQQQVIHDNPKRPAKAKK